MISLLEIDGRKSGTLKWFEMSWILYKICMLDEVFLSVGWCSIAEKEEIELN